MKEFVVRVPDGWGVKLVAYLLLAALSLFAYPYYRIYINSVEARAVVQQAQAQAEARRILGECKNEP